MFHLFFLCILCSIVVIFWFVALGHLTLAVNPLYLFFVFCGFFDFVLFPFFLFSLVSAFPFCPFLFFCLSLGIKDPRPGRHPETRSEHEHNQKKNLKSPKKTKKKQLTKTKK